MKSITPCFAEGFLAFSICTAGIFYGRNKMAFRIIKVKCKNCLNLLPLTSLCDLRIHKIDKNKERECIYYKAKNKRLKRACR